MAQTRVTSLAFGGVNSNSNPANFPVGRSVRCRNWQPLDNGELRLRLGYQRITAPFDTSEIHTATYYEQFDGTQFVIFSQGANIRRVNMNTGSVNNIGTLSNGNRWGQFRANNKAHLSNGTDFLSWDGSTLRPNGIRAPNSTETGSISVTVTTATPGSVSTTSTSLSGLDAYMAYYNPQTGHVGNRTKITASKFHVTISGASIVFSGLPDISGVDAEWVKVIGLTPDNGEIPYWLLDASGNRIIVNGSATVATYTLDSRDFTAELPTRNSVGSGFSGFAKVGTRIFAIKPNDVFMYYSNAEEDVVSGIYIGRPEESWPANNAEAYPTAEVPTCVGSYNFEAWVFSRNYLMRWSETLRQQVTDPWIGPYAVGCAGQRAFIVTPYGPFWVTADAELYTWSDGGPIEAGNEYVHSLLEQIGKEFIGETEIIYHRDKAQRIDQLKILAKDADGNRLPLIIHDFLIKDSDSPFGQAYEVSYTKMQPTTFVGSGYSPYVPVRDYVTKQLRCWTGGQSTETVLEAQFSQLDDLYTDNASTYSADYVSGPVALGPTDKQISDLEVMGDSGIQVSYSNQMSDTFNEFQPMTREDWREGDAIAQYKVTDHGRFIRFRIQLDSTLDGSLADSNPFTIPLNTYGRLFSLTPKFGAERRESRG